MSECENAIAGGKMSMLAYLEGRQIKIYHQWYTVENGWAAGVCLVNYGVDTLTRFCHMAKEV